MTEKRWLLHIEGFLRVLFLTHPYGVDSEKPRFSFKFASQISRRFAPWFSYGKQTRTALGGASSGKSAIFPKKDCIKVVKLYGVALDNYVEKW